jgi:hypothetical protein
MRTIDKYPTAADSKDHMNREWGCVYERVLDRHLGFSLMGLRHRLPEIERPYWAKHVGKQITVDDEYKRGILLIEPRRMGNLRNLYVIRFIRNGYAWLDNVYVAVENAEELFIKEFRH